MEVWSNEELLNWVASKGFGVWTPYLKDDKLTGNVFISMSQEDIMGYNVDKHVAKRLVMKRDKIVKVGNTNGNTNNSSGRGTLRRLMSLKRDKGHARSESSGDISPRGISSLNLLATAIEEDNTTTNTNNGTSDNLKEKRNLTIYHSYSNSANSYLFGKKTEITSPTPASTASPTGVKSPKLKVTDLFPSSPLKTSNGVEDKGRIGTPFNITHNVHVEFNKDVGFIGLPVEWKTFLEENLELGLASRRKPGRKMMRSYRESTYVKDLAVAQWEVKNVTDWLEVIGFSMYKTQFESSNCNGLKLANMTKEEMEAMGIPDEKHVESILKQIVLLTTAPLKMVNLNLPKIRQRSKSTDTGGGSLLKRRSKNYNNNDIGLDDPDSDTDSYYNNEDTKIYGVALDCLMRRQKDRYPDLKVPLLVHKIFGYIRLRGLQEHGIFRISPSLTKIREWRDKIDSGEEVELDDILDCHLVSALLKQFLRELPDPIIPQGVYSLCICALNKDLSIMREALKMIPEINYEFLYQTLTLLHLITEHEKDNLMNAENLSKVFGPTLLWQNTIFDGMLDPLGPIQLANDLVLTFITSYAFLFPPPVPSKKSENIRHSDPIPKSPDMLSDLHPISKNAIPTLSPDLRAKSSSSPDTPFSMSPSSSPDTLTKKPSISVPARKMTSAILPLPLSPPTSPPTSPLLPTTALLSPTPSPLLPTTSPLAQSLPLLHSSPLSPSSAPGERTPLLSPTLSPPMEVLPLTPQPKMRPARSVNELAPAKPVEVGFVNELGLSGELNSSMQELIGGEEKSKLGESKGLFRRTRSTGQMPPDPTAQDGAVTEKKTNNFRLATITPKFLRKL